MAPNRALPAKDRSIQAAKYAGSGVETEYRITGVPGLVLAVGAPRKDGKHKRVWRVNYTAESEAGKRTTRKLRLGRYPTVRLREAMARALQVREAIDRGADPVADARIEIAKSNSQALTFADLVQDYIDERRVAQDAIRSIDEIERVLRRDALPQLGLMHPAVITDVDIEECVDEVAKRGSLAMARRLLTHLRTVFNYATLRSARMRQRYGPTHNPAALVGRGPGRGQAGKYGRNRARDRVLSDTEIVEFWYALDQYPAEPSTNAILRCLLLTGQRASEVREMDVRELRLGKQPEWEIPKSRTKNQQVHIVPLAEPVAKLITHHVGNRKQGPVFLTDRGNPVGEYTPPTGDAAHVGEGASSNPQVQPA